MDHFLVPFLCRFFVLQLRAALVIAALVVPTGIEPVTIWSGIPGQGLQRPFLILNQLNISCFGSSRTAVCRPRAEIENKKERFSIVTPLKTAVPILCRFCFPK